MKTACPKCSHIYPVPDDATGKTARCKKCDAVFKVEPFVELDLEEVNDADIPDADVAPPQKKTPPKTLTLLLFSVGAAAVVSILLFVVQGAFRILMDDVDWFLVPPIIIGIYTAIALFFIEKTTSGAVAKSLYIGFLVVMATTYFTAHQFASPDFPSLAKPNHDKFEAYVMSQQFVEDRLKSPSSAKFPARSTAYIKHLGNGRYHVVAHVDSQNSFGAMIRNKFICELHTDDGNRWTCDTLVFDP